MTIEGEKSTSTLWFISADLLRLAFPSMFDQLKPSCREIRVLGIDKIDCEVPDEDEGLLFDEVGHL